jgi:hypothetical protein
MTADRPKELNDRNASKSNDLDVYLLIAACAVALICALLKTSANHTLWYDEVTLYVNLRDTPFSDLFGMLPFYDQAAPPLYNIVGSALARLAGLNEFLLRLPSLLALAGIGALALNFPRMEKRQRAAFCLASVTSYTLLSYSVQAKHYALEMLVIYLALYVGLAPLRGCAGAALRLLAFLLLSLASFLAPLVLGAIIVFQLADAWRAERQEGAAPGVAALASRHMTRVLPLVIGGVATLAVYFLISRNISDFQFQNYRYTYDPGYSRGNALAFYFGALRSMMDSHRATLGMLSIALFAVGMATAAWRRTRLALPFLALLLAPLLLNLLGAFPLIGGRYSLILLPSIAYFVSLGIATLLEMLEGRWRWAGAAFVAALFLFIPVRWLMTPSGQESRQVIEAVRTRLDAGQPVLSTLGAQPLIDAYLGPFGGPACTGHPPALLGWTNRCSIARKDQSPPGFIGLPTAWIYMNYIGHVAMGGAVFDLPRATAEVWIDDYLRFLRQQACGTEDALIALSHLTLDFRERLVKTLESAGTVTLVLDSDPSRKLEDDGALLKWVRLPGSPGCVPGAAL